MAHLRLLANNSNLNLPIQKKFYLNLFQKTKEDKFLEQVK